MVSGVNTTPIQLTYAALIDEDNPYQANLDATGPGGATVQNLASLDQIILSNTNTTSIALSGGSTATPNEDDTISFEITGVVPDASNYKYWFVGSGITSSDFGAITPNGFGSVSSKKDVAIVSGAATITVPIAADQNREGNETFNLILGGTGTNNPPIAQSPTITIQDTSLPIVSVKNYTSLSSGVEALTVTEDNNLYIGVTSIGNQDPAIPFTVTLSGAGSGVYSGVTEQTIANPVMGGTSYVTFIADGDDGVSDGPRAIDVTVTETQGSTTIATTSLTLNDEPASYALNLTSSSTPNEGDTLTFDIVTTNVLNTTELFVRPIDFIGKSVDLQSPSDIIVVNGDTSGLVQGMQALQTIGGNTIDGSISSVASNSISMNQNQSDVAIAADALFSNSGNWLYFFNSPNYVASNSVVMNTGTKSINVITSENAQEFTDKTFTFGLYESQISNTPLATESVTLTNITPGSAIDYVVNQNLAFGVGQSSEGITVSSLQIASISEGETSSVTASITFKSNGLIEAATQQNSFGGINDYPLLTRTIGYWNSGASGGAVPDIGDDFTITATDKNTLTPLDEITGNFDTSVSLENDQTWEISYTYGGPGERASTTQFTITITDNNSGQSVSEDVQISTVINNENVEPGGGQ